MQSATDTPANPPELLNVPELAELLRIPEKTAYDWLANGRIPGATKIGADERGRGGLWRAHRPTVVAWVSGQICAPPKKGRRR